jgi:hypothetical protein
MLDKPDQDVEATVGVQPRLPRPGAARRLGDDLRPISTTPFCRGSDNVLIGWSEGAAMTPEQEHKLDELSQRQSLLCQRLQRLAEAMASKAFHRDQGVTPDEAQDDAAELRAWEETLRRIEEATDEQEGLLRNAGILP